MTGFTLTKPTYSPREFAQLYTAYVRQISYATILKWIEEYRNGGGETGIYAIREERSRYYRIPAAEARRVLLAAGAVEHVTK